MISALKPMGDYLEQVSVSKADIDLSLANQTTQTLNIFTIPPNSIVTYLVVSNNGATITSTGTLDHFNVSCLSG